MSATTPATRDDAAHWQGVYQTKQPDQVSWFSPHLGVSLGLLNEAGMNPLSRVIDVGGGASTLVDDLLEAGLREITVLDISAASLEVARQRLTVRASEVRWVTANAARMDLMASSYDYWHDRAAFHFLLDPADVAHYVANAARAIRIGGCAVIGCFASDGPERCSGLPVARREPADIAQVFGSRFELVASAHEQHVTPWGTPQSFAYATLRRSSIQAL